MDWYYAVGADRKGPVSEEELQGLVQQGAITLQTLVWRTGFSDWRPYGESVVSARAGDTLGESVTCAGCGGSFSRSDVIALAECLYCATCKPLALQRLKEGVHSNTAAEGIRKAHLRHEASVQSIGLLYYLGSVLFVCGGTAVLVRVFSIGRSPRALGAAVLSFAVFLAFGAGQFWVGTGLRRLRKWARIPTGIFSGLGLLWFPLGTIINAYVPHLQSEGKDGVFGRVSSRDPADSAY